MGAVFQVRDRALDETVALKLLRADLLGPGLARFRSEIKLARQVAHRNVCRIFEYGEDGTARFIVMELLVGETLRQLVRRGPLPVERALRIAVQAAEGLGAIHQAGIVHRDVKTTNLLLTGDEVLKVMDFGIAKSLAAEGVTETGMLVGTPEYMSPEQAAGRAVDGRSDLYSLGIVLYEMLSAEVPFRGDTPVATLWKHLNETASFDSPAARQIPPRVRPLLERLLAKSPSERPATAAELAAALRSASAGEDAATTPTAIAPRPSRRGPVVAALVAGVGALAVAVLLLTRRTATNPGPAPHDGAAPTPASVPGAPPAEPPRSPTPRDDATVAPPLRRPPSSRPVATPAPVPPARVASSQLSSRALAALDRGDVDAARRNLDAVLARKDPIRFSMAREKRLRVDRWTLIVQPAKTTLLPGGGMQIAATLVTLEDERGGVAAEAPIHRVKVEETGRSQPTLNHSDRSPGAYLRLKLGGESYNLYFWPRRARCQTVQRLGSFNSFLQCDARGLTQQSFVAEYVAGSLSR